MFLTEQSDDLLSMKQAADLLGLSQRQFYNLRASEGLEIVAVTEPVPTRQRATKVRRSDVERLKRKREGSTEES